ncbi:hypothetical protein BJ912DRAFT_962209 [Pholiota molesta]|nr:hypothetical protein BJ912DRAFT_962209 [Pholiota molesta]
MADAEEKDRLLSILQGHGQSFLSSFGVIDDSSKKEKKKSRKNEVSDDNEEEEEWFGIGKEAPSDDDSEEEEEETGSEFEHTDDEFTNSKVESNVVVFSDPSVKKTTTIDHVSKTQMKAFMNVVVFKDIQNIINSLEPALAKQNKEEEEEDKTNAQNDAILHKLVHTKLLSGSMTTELDLTPAQRRKALAGRLGKGERLVRDAEKRKAAKRVREGLASKQKERNMQELEEAKNLGNYHPTLKKVFEASASVPTTRKREKGLKMGVGKFSNGALRLSREDVNMAMGNHGSSSSRGSRGGGRGRGRGRGKSGKRK